MEQFTEGESTREEIKNKLRQNFDGKIVRKDLTKKIREGANVTIMPWFSLLIKHDIRPYMVSQSFTLNH